MRIGRIAAAVFALALIGAACDDGGDDKAEEDKSGEDGGTADQISKGTFLIEPRDGEGTDDEDASEEEEETDDDEDAQPPRTQPDEEEEPSGGGGPTGDFETVTDNTETVAVDVPSHWTNVADIAVDEDGDGERDPGIGVAAATDLEEWVDTWGVSGLIFAATSDPGALTVQGDFEAALAGNAYPDECVDEGIEAFSAAEYSGQIQYWSDCDGTGTQWVVLAAQAVDGSHGVVLTVALAPEDEDALDTILESLTVNGPVEG